MEKSMSVALLATATRSCDSIGVFVWASTPYTVTMLSKPRGQIVTTKTERWQFTCRRAFPAPGPDGLLLGPVRCRLFVRFLTLPPWRRLLLSNHFVIKRFIGPVIML